jgi:hypothetical protein
LDAIAFRYDQANGNENKIQNANSNKEENASRKGNKSEENLIRKNDIFKRLTTAEFPQSLSRNNTFKKLIMTDIR